MILLYRAISTLIDLIEILILARIVLSFLRIESIGFITKFVYELTEPILDPARKVISKIGINTGMFDFSPILAILILRIIGDIFYRILL